MSFWDWLERQGDETKWLLGAVLIILVMGLSDALSNCGAHK